MEDITVEKKIIKGKPFYNVQFLDKNNIISIILDQENYEWLNNTLRICK